MTELTWPFSDMRRAKLLLTDALIAATAPARPGLDMDDDATRPDTAGPQLAN